MLSKDDVGFISICLSSLAAIFGVVACRRSTKVASSIGRTIDELSRKDIEIDISKEFIEKAAKKHVERKIDLMMPSVKNDAIQAAKSAFKAVIESEINSQYADTKGEVKRALKERIGHIDISDIKREVVEDAKEEAEAKFKDQLDDVLDSFNGRLEDVGKIYSSIAKKFESK